MNHLFKKKLENIHSNLMECYRDSQSYSSSITGAEREVVNKELLSLILPPGYRIGSGAIVDADSNETGQIDAVIEQPFSLSFPICSDTNRLYLADTVGAAFEIKSNLYNQKDDAINKIREIKKLKRFHVEGGEHVFFDKLEIPSFIIGFKGHNTTESLEDTFMPARTRHVANGVLNVESELFCGRSSDGNWRYGSGKAESILAFLSCVVNSLKHGVREHTDLDRYSVLLK
ncbi:DUF6602 domain-containing protein [Vibrio vulnificus]|uniref:DUF6602 domain-containing protein n=1 Tax=Vibrio vulnificus TaxID=672 RepID=UPI0032ED6F89